MSSQDFHQNFKKKEALILQLQDPDNKKKPPRKSFNHLKCRLIWV